MRDIFENPDPDNNNMNRAEDIGKVTVEEHILFDYSGQGGNILQKDGGQKPAGSSSKSRKSVRRKHIGTALKNRNTVETGKTGKSGRSGKKTKASKIGKTLFAAADKKGTTKKGRRRKKGGSILVSPFPYLGLAIILSAILFFFGGQGEKSTSTDPAAGTQGQIADSEVLRETHALTANTHAGLSADEQSSQAAVPAANDSGADVPGNTPAQNVPAADPNLPVQDVSALNTPVPAASANTPAQGASALNTPVPAASANTPAQGASAVTDTGANTPAAVGAEETKNSTPGAGPSAATPVHPVQEDADGDGTEPVPVESVTITADTDRMVMCDTLQLTAVVSPKNATNPSMLWFSDDETIARVSQNGLVTSMSAGNVIISTVSSNGITTGFPIHVVDHKKIMTMTVDSECIQNNKVGNKWTYKYSMDGNTIHSTQNVPIQIGQTIRLAAQILEHDSDPDKGESETSFTVDSASLKDGFEVLQEVVVEENTGKLAGNTATFLVTYRFTDAVE